jgi:hypothetical protein
VSWGVLGLPAPFLGAALQGLELSLQVLHEGGVGRLVDALQFVGVGLEVVEFYLPVIVLDVLVGPGPHRLEGRLAAGPGPVVSPWRRQLKEGDRVAHDRAIHSVA